MGAVSTTSHYAIPIRTSGSSTVAARYNLAPPGPTQSYSGTFTRSAIHTSPASARFFSTTTAQFLGNGKFTIEFWIFIPANTTTAGVGIFGNRYILNGVSNTNTPRLHCWYNFANNNGCIWLFNMVGGSGNQFLQSQEIQTGQWNHVAFTRDYLNICRVFINGVMGPNTREWTTNFSSDNQWAIGRAYRDLSQEYLVINSRITGFSMSRECYYTNNFTPVKQRLQNDSTKILLLNFNDSNPLVLVTDSSSSNNTITNNNSMGFSTDVPV